MLETWRIVSFIKSILFLVADNSGVALPGLERMVPEPDLQIHPNFLKMQMSEPDPGL